MRRGWAVAGAIVLAATVLGGLVAGCEKNRDRVKVVKVRPRHDRPVYIDRDRGRDVYSDRDRRDNDRDRDRRDRERDRDRDRNRDRDRRDREISKESRRDN